MNRQWLVACLGAALLVPPASAADSTAELLEARRVPEFVALKLQDGSLRYQIGASPLVLWDLGENKTFLAVSDVYLVLDDYNPFTNAFSARDTESADPNFVQLQSFVSDLLKLPGVVNAADKAKESVLKPISGQPLSMGPFAPVGPGQPARTSTPPTDSFMVSFECQPLSDFSAKLSDLRTHLSTGTLSLEALRSKMIGANGYEKIVDAKKAIDGYYLQVAAEVKAIGSLEEQLSSTAVELRKKSEEAAAAKREVREASAQVSRYEVRLQQARSRRQRAAALQESDKCAHCRKTTAASRTAAEEWAAQEELKKWQQRLTQNEERLKGAPCLEVQTVALSDLLFLSLNADTLLTAKKNLAAALKNLSTTLELIVDRERWTRGQQYYIAYHHKELEKGRKLDVVFQMSPVSIRLDGGSDANGLVFEKGQLRQGALSFRDSSIFVPEVAVGAVYSNLKRQKYGVIQDPASKTIRVAATGEESVGLQGAVLANFVCRCWGRSVLYPMIQLGVSVDPSSPALLVGGGLRLTNPIPIGLTFGAVPLAWVKGLDKLKVGQSIDNETFLEQDLKLKRVTGAATYIALQTSFTF